eukprot:scpid31659/ scgid0556/ 
MDNANLENIKFSCGELRPAFDPGITEYTLVQPSTEAKLTLGVYLCDTGACYQTVVGGKKTPDKTVTIAEGASQEVSINVSSEDGSCSKSYKIKIVRLSSGDASLAGLKLSCGTLSPEFSPTILEYSVEVPATCCEVDVEGKLPDSKMSVDVHGSGKPHALVELNAGQMDVKVQVTSANGSVVTCYTVNFRRDHWGFVPNEVPREYECPICSNVIHCAAYSKVSGKHRYCHACIVEMTRTRNVDFVSQQHLGSERIQLDEAHDKQIAELKIRCPCCTRSLPLSKMNAHLATCDNKTDKKDEACKKCSLRFLTCDATYHKKSICNAEHKPKTLQPPFKLRPWEKQLRNQRPPSSADDIAVLMAEGKKFEQQYRKSLPSRGQPMQFEEGESPMDYLEKASVCYAAVNSMARQKNGEGHLRLGLVQEEVNYITEKYGCQKEQDHDNDANAAAKATGKQEEFLAICHMHGVAADAPFAEQLKALETEIQAMKEIRDMGAAEHVQALHNWASAQSSKARHSGDQYADETSQLAKAFAKYCDAVSIEATHPVYNFHCGRMLLQQKDFKHATRCFQIAVGGKPNCVMYRYYLGLSLVMNNNPNVERYEEAITYLRDGMTSMERRSWKNPATPPSPLSTENALDPHAPMVLVGLVSLTQIYPELGKVERAIETARFVAHFSTQALQTCQHSRSDVRTRLFWCLIDAHTHIILALTSVLQTGENPPGHSFQLHVAYCCVRLMSLIKSSNIPPTDRLLNKLQIRVSTLCWHILLDRNAHIPALLGSDGRFTRVCWPFCIYIVTNVEPPTVSTEYSTFF